MGAPQGITLSEAMHPFSFLVSEDSDGEGYLSRDEVTIAPSQTIVVGQVLTTVATVVTKASKAGMTGGGALMLASPANVAGAQEGAYKVVCIGGATSATSAKKAGMVGGGSLGTLTSDTDAAVGEWRAVCAAIATGGGEFDVFNPAGGLDGVATVGVAYNSPHGPNFTISASGTDFALADEFDITVAASVPSHGGVFAVTDPSGVFVANATVGAAFSNQIAFTIAYATADFAVGDEFDVTVVFAAYAAWAPGDTAKAIAGYSCVTGAGQTAPLTVINAHAAVRLTDITFGGSPSAAQIAAAQADLAANLVKFR
jgi:hypothetical protein